MAFDSLSEYIDTLESIGKLHHVKAEVDTNLEIAEVMRRMMYSGNSPAILFENVKGYNIPILGNAFGTVDLLKTALNLSDFKEIGKRVTDLTKLKIPSNLFDKLKVLPKLSEIGAYAPKYVESGPVTEIIETEKANLNSLPILKSFPNDAAKFITFGLTITKHPETGIRNIGVYRIQIVNEKKAIMHWQTHKRGAQHYEILKEHHKTIETAIVIGTDPSTIFSGIAPVPEGMDKFFFSGIVRKKGLKLVKCKTVNLEVPVNSEIVLEGYVDLMK
ncbi:MAG TPA: UbiD family decarboxylase domain-containing protein [Nitrososphaeraceae archaeon]|nr:UbiD family decarboxylase domain-containing protein [Nitrososphaeraceae archaeon]